MPHSAKASDLIISARAWTTMVADLEADLMRNTATVSGGRGRDESAVAYMHRVRKAQDSILVDLRAAQQRLKRTKDRARRVGKLQAIFGEKAV